MLAGIKNDLDPIVEALIYLYTEGRRLTKEAAGHWGLSGGQLSALKLLEAVGDLSLSEVGERIRAQNSTVTTIVDRLEADGLALRERSVEDRRVWKIRLTPKGAALAKKVPISSMEVLYTALGALSAREQADFLRVLKKVARGVADAVRGTKPAESSTNGGNDHGRVQSPQSQR